MIEITKQGHTKLKKISFSCYKCGCEWNATRDEVNYSLGRYVMKCPCCFTLAGVDYHVDSSVKVSDNKNWVTPSADNTIESGWYAVVYDGSLHIAELGILLGESYWIIDHSKPLEIDKVTYYLRLPIVPREEEEEYENAQAH